MADYIEREAVLARERLEYTRCLDSEIKKGYWEGVDDIFAHVKSIPSANVIEVVRCRDCVAWEKRTVSEKGYTICPASGMEITADDFCSYGEMRSDNQTDAERRSDYAPD